tara:strand:+ start:13810 stop:14016 length:207 start_codon:yes stop_codon:yes gene_type:complete
MSWEEILNAIPQDEATQSYIQEVLLEFRNGYKGFREVVQSGSPQQLLPAAKTFYEALGKWIEINERYV